MILITAPITIAASIARGSGDINDANGRNNNTTVPVTAPLHFVRPPVMRAMELLENDPPIGNPPENAAVMFATPWLTNSRSGFHPSLSFVANEREIAEASAKPTSAMTAPGSSNDPCQETPLYRRLEAPKGWEGRTGCAAVNRRGPSGETGTRP